MTQEPLLCISYNHHETYPLSTFYCSEFFKLMNEVENEDLVFTLETIVDKFGEEMAPYALGLCQNLVIFSFSSTPEHQSIVF